MAANSLVSEKCCIALLIERHRGQPWHLQRLKELQEQYNAIRRTCADGSCFYRGLGFAFLEYLLGKHQDLLQFRERVIQSKQDLRAAGFQDIVYKPHYKTFLSLVDAALGEGVVGEAATRDLLRAFNHTAVSDSATLYLRLVTSAFLRSRADFYTPFLEGTRSMEDFCAQCVEPMMAVVDHIQIMAVTQALGIPLQVEYVDASNPAITQHTFPEDARPCVYMLYCEDHYTLLYKRHEDPPV